MNRDKFEEEEPNSHGNPRNTRRDFRRTAYSNVEVQKCPKCGYFDPKVGCDCIEEDIPETS